MIEISVVIPLYKCSRFIRQLVDRLGNELRKITSNYEIIFVNDASPEDDWEIVCSLAQNNNRIKGLCQSRNFGQHSSIVLGLENAKGKWVVVMDGDLQDRPEEIIRLYKKAQAGYDIVLAQRHQRKDTFIKKMTSKVFYKIFNYLTDTKQDPLIANFGIYKNEVIQEVLKMKDHIKFFPTMVQWVGFNSSSIQVEHDSRMIGKSSYSFIKLFKLAFNVIVSFSAKPLYLAIRFGLFITFVSLFVGLYYFYRYYTGQIEVLGFTTLIISLWFIAGVIITIIGVVGLYLGKVFENVKNRPNYIIKDRVNL